MPPVLLGRGEIESVHRHNDRLASIALADDFDAIRRMLSGGKIDNKPFADSSPARVFAAPLNTATRPRELFAIVQTTAGPNDSVGEMCTRALKDMSGGPGMCL